MKQRESFLASNIKYLRQVNNKTQHDLADVCNKKNTAISNWELGIREPDSVDLGILSQLFNVSVDDLVFTDLKLHNALSNLFNEDLNLKPITKSQNKLLTATKGFTDEQLNKVLDYIEFLKSKK